ncbi:energy coupling factor transporter S component ThiW [Clostridium fermenticellae]|uniref:Energy coupling factor transporter S component ThiW n=1 Tax=Clostridium fermenticellae TaxID=2068654 RepID=A0A386H3D1_9CLOT|nr:energy coupling factor transporter S component ThiW [Clostridium fermenticellae]AYD40176.1 energy coupling factor transporter S component ThiW [Clostridium fermenticellae]
MKKKSKLLRKLMLAMMIAMGVVISPILRIEGMCPMSSVINITCAVILGPWYALLCAVLIGIIRMLIMGIPPLALTGAVFGAFLSGVLYRISRNNLLFAALGETIGTGIIGAVVSSPIMTYFWGRKELSLMFYVPLFFTATIIGGVIALVFLGALNKNGMLIKIQQRLGMEICEKVPIIKKDVSVNKTEF